MVQDNYESLAVFFNFVYGRIPTTQYGVSHAVDEQWKVNNARLMYYVNKIHKNAIGYLKNKEIISFTGEHFKKIE